ncbi:CBS domain-containing protein [Aspergillus luchuensis]|nr:CBS domain-containing protein [Aspergillus luchuensis]
MAYPEQFREVSRYRSYSVKSVEMGMPEYWKEVKSDTLSWRTVLSLDPSIARVPDLVEIASIRNLVALEISSPPQTWNNGESSGVTLSNRIIRSWNEMQQSSGAFAHLRVLVLSRQCDLSVQIFQYLRDFPSLEIVLAADCGDLTKASKVDFQVDGWLVDPDTKRDGTLYDQYLSVIKSEAKNPTGLDAAPVLNFEINPSKTKRDTPMRKEQVCFYRDGSKTYKHEQESDRKRPRGYPQMKIQRPDKYRKIGWEGLLGDLS